MNDEAFYLRVAHALSGCQLVEQGLKLYITEALDLVRKRTDGIVPFKMTGSNYENSSLEGLIKLFRQLSDNEDLVRELDRFKDKRNFLSHKAITACLDPNGELSTADARKLCEIDGPLDEIQVDALVLQKAIHEEANRFRGHLYFEDLTKSDE